MLLYDEMNLFNYVNSTGAVDNISNWMMTSSTTDSSPTPIVAQSLLFPSALPPSTASGMADVCVQFRVIFNAVVIGLLCVFGLAGNALSVAVLQRDRHNRVAVFLLKALSVADSWVLVVSFVVLSVFYGLLPQLDVDGLRRARPYVVKYVNPLGPMAQTCTVWMTVLLGVNRYIAVCRPFAVGKALTVTGARIQVAVVVVLSVALNMPRFFQYDIVYETSPLTNLTSEFPTHRLSSLGQHVVFEVIYTNALYTSVALILPLLLLVLVNAKLIHQLQLSKRSMRNNSLHYVGSHENSITTVMVSIILTLLVCHTPDRVVQVLKFFSAGQSWRCPLPLYYAANAANGLVVFNSSVNFVVYYVFRRRFRVILRSKLCHWLRPRHDSMSDRKLSTDPMNPLLVNFKQIG